MTKQYRWWMVLPITLLAMAGMACLGTPAATAPPTGAVPTAAPATVAPEPTTAEVTEVVSSSGDAKAALVRALRAHLTAGPYRVVSSITTGATTIAMHGEVDLPDKFHLVAAINGGPEREYIIIGSATYAKSGGQWSQVELDLTSLIEGFVNSVNPDNISNVNVAGTEDVNGQPAAAYTFVYSNTVNGTEITNNDETWVDVASGLPVKQMVDGELNGSVYHTEQTIERDASITIEAPAVP